MTPAAPAQDVGEDRARFEAVMREKYGPSAWTSHVSWWIWCAARNEAAAELTRLRAALDAANARAEALREALERLVACMGERQMDIPSPVLLAARRALADAIQVE